MEQSNAGFESGPVDAVPRNGSVQMMEPETGKSSEALVDTTKKRRNRLLVLFGVLLVIVFVITIITVAALKSAESNSAGIFGELGTKISFSDFIEDKFSPRGFNGTWVGDEEISYLSSDNDILLYHVGKKETSLLVPHEFLISKRMERFKVSPSKKYVLFSQNVQQVFRYSTRAVYSKYDVQSQLLTYISTDGKPGQLLDYAAWIPNSDDLIFVFENNIYIQNNNNNPVEITTDGDPLNIFNGVPDWVYQEEILASDVAMWLSPDSKRLAYLKFIDTKVDNFNFTIYGDISTNNYPKTAHLRYPRPGKTNPKVTLNVADILSQGVTSIELEEPKELGESYIFSVVWISATELAVHWVNRVQNDSFIVKYDLTKRSLGQIMPDKLYRLHTTSGWLETENPPVFSTVHKDVFLIIANVPIGMEDYQHVVMVARGSHTALSKDTFTVTKILHWDEQRHVIYFTATGDNEPGQRHLYRITDPHHEQPDELTCLTCDLKNSAGEPCPFNSFNPNPSFTYTTMTCEAPFQVKEVTLYDVTSNFQSSSIWNDNSLVKKNLSEKALPKVFDVDVNLKSGYVSKVKLFLPPEFDASKSYPMIVNTYAGPNSQQVSEKWNGVDWGAFLSSGKSIIYAMIDGRGSGFKGNKMLFEMYRKLGSVESDDQIEVVQYLKDTYSYINKENVGIWGWSYGGYNTARVLAKDDSNVFKCGISVAPVTSWLFYDSAYTERYMGMPYQDDNFLGYQESDLMHLANKFANKKYFLIHGTADDNVHFQQSMLFARALEEEVIMFQQMTYPDEAHSLRGVKPHLYKSMLEFWEECFDINTEKS